MKEPKTIILTEILDRDTKSIACSARKNFSTPICNGYCDNVSCTKEEVKEYQQCGRKHECCLAAFVCRRCKTRFIAKLAAPDCNW